MWQRTQADNVYGVVISRAILTREVNRRRGKVTGEILCLHFDAYNEPTLPVRLKIVLGGRYGAVLHVL